MKASPLLATDPFRLSGPPTSDQENEQEAFDTANESRLVNVTWGVTQTVGSAALLFCIYLILVDRLPAWWTISFFFAGYALVWALYQFKAYLTARYLLWTSCTAGVVAVELYFGSGSLAHVLAIPTMLGTLLLFSSVGTRVYLTVAHVVLMIAASFWMSAETAVIPPEEQHIFQGVFFVLAVWVSVDIIQRFFTLNRRFRMRSRMLVDQLSERNTSLEQERARLDAQAAELRQVHVRLRQQISQRELLGHQLRGSNEQLEQFAYAASHDLKEPLRSISSFVQLIRRRITGEEDRLLNEYFDYVVTSAGEMTALLDGLLLYSRAGRISAAPELVSLDKTTALLRYEFASQLAESGAVLDIGPLGEVFFGKKEAREVFAQVLCNALKFSPKGEVPQVKVRRTEETLGFARFEVTDRGIGIDPAYRDKVFQLFQRLNTRDAYQGSGIGLALVKKLVEVSGGAIGFSDAADDPGLTCWFTLPTQAPAHAN